MRKYIEVVDELKVCLNFRSTNELKAKNNKQVFNFCLCELKDDFKTDVSTKFLRGLVIGDDKQKSNRVTYLLNQIGLKDRLRVMDCFIEKFPTTTIKDVDVCLYKAKKVKGVEHISLRVVGMTSHDYNGIKAPCKVGITSRKLRTVTLNELVI